MEQIRLEDNKTVLKGEIIDELREFIIRMYGIEEMVLTVAQNQAAEAFKIEKELTKQNETVEKKIGYLKSSKEYNANNLFEIENYYFLNDKLHANFYRQQYIINGMVVSIVSAFDYFIHNLLKIAINYLSEKFSFDEKIFKKDEIERCATEEEIKEYRIDKYLGLLFKKSHAGLYEEVKVKFGIEDIKESGYFKALIFITELRNIIVHNDSKVSIIFKNNMKKYDIDYSQFEPLKSSFGMLLSPEDFGWIIEAVIISGIRFTISYVKHYFEIEESGYAEIVEEINRICLKYILKGHSRISFEIFDSLIKESTDSSKKLEFTINKCICLKEQGKIDEMKECLDALDWENCTEKEIFKKDCLLDDIESAIAYLKGQEDMERWKYCIQTNPLFKNLIQSKIFLGKYEEIFNEKFQSRIIDKII